MIILAHAYLILMAATSVSFYHQHYVKRSEPNAWIGVGFIMMLLIGCVMSVLTILGG